jgi:hypothetical protein
LRLPAGLTPPRTAATATAGTATAATAETTATAATLGFGASFIDIQRAAVKFLAIEGGNRPVGLGGVRHFDECETARAAGVPIGDQVDTFYVPVRLKEPTDGRFGCGKIQIANKDVFHGVSFCFWLFGRKTRQSRIQPGCCGKSKYISEFTTNDEVRSSAFPGQLRAGSEQAGEDLPAPPGPAEHLPRLCYNLIALT